MAMDIDNINIKLNNILDEFKTDLSTHSNTYFTIFIDYYKQSNNYKGKIFFN